MEAFVEDIDEAPPLDSAALDSSIVEGLDDDAPPPPPPPLPPPAHDDDHIHIDGVEDDEEDEVRGDEVSGTGRLPSFPTDVCSPAAAPASGGGGGGGGGGDADPDAALMPPPPPPASASAATPFVGPPRALKRWPLPPSLTPKKRHKAGALPEVALDLQATRSQEDGAWHCGTCDAPYESRIGLFAHARFCAGRAAAWACEWCACSEAETQGKASGPNGIRTLCSACGQRYRNGAEGMPQQNEKGDWVCPQCSRTFPTMGALGGHRRFCDGGVWRCQWCECKYEDCTGKGPGPDGPMTLCSACSGRFRSGQSGPPLRDEDGKYVCEGCLKLFDTISGVGSHRKRCDGGVWRCKWCSCNSQETSGKGPGPGGKSELCSLCSARWRGGHTGPPETDADGRYPCEKCERTFEEFRALSVHARNCDGGAWRCNWCACKAEETSGKSPGPDGPRTLCGACASRYRAGHTGPPPKNEEGKYLCEKCERAFDNISSLGGHSRFCDGGNWRCGWCKLKRDECSGKGPGPEGAQTLCSLCSNRWKSGHTGLPEAGPDGRYPCERCERTFESFRALGIHMRGCDGGHWRCEWCACKAEETSGKSPGPNGPRTLCGNCGGRYRSGATGPPVVNAFGQYPCDLCGRSFETISGLGGHRRRCNVGK